MRLPAYVVHASLALLFVIAASARFSEVTLRTSPYFTGVSAMGYRHVLAVADGEDLTQSTHKANWPDGYVPATYRPSGLEFAAGQLFRLVRYLSDTDARDYLRRLVGLAAASLVFVLYALARGMWSCQAAGLIAAFMVVFLQPFVDATNGRSFDHTFVTVFLAALHALAWLRHRRGRSPLPAVLAALVAAAMLAVSEVAPYYLAVVCVLAATFPGYSRRDRVLLAGLHAAVLVAASLWLPYLAALRMIACWPTVCAVAVAVAAAVPWGGAGPARRVLTVAAVVVVVTVALAPVRAGAQTDFPAVSYVAWRLRYLFGRPEAPLQLPDAIRHLWSVEHAPPSAHQALAFLLPLAFLGAALALNVRRLPQRRTLALVLPAAALAVVAYCVDRSAVAMATVVAAPVVAAAGRDLSRAMRSRGVLLGAGAFLVLAQFMFPLGAANPTLALARALKVEHHDPARFLWVSTENTDLSLVKFVAAHTSVRDPILGSPATTALLLAFTGRTSVHLEGTFARSAASRCVELTAAFYDDESTFANECRRLGVTHVLYSVDLLLDTTSYSPRYLAGREDVTPESVAWQMHFRPEELSAFELEFENEHYRLFRVGAPTRPAFITDHPTVYQEEVFEAAGGDLDAFRRLNTDLILSWSDATAARVRGDYERALALLRWCLERAPRFTRARITLAETYMQMGQLERARDTILEVVEYAPDNALALYQVAYIFAQMGEMEKARGYLDVLRTAATDPDLIDRARLLEAIVERDLGAPADSAGGVRPESTSAGTRIR